jgi:hypothetical protein
LTTRLLEDCRVKTYGFSVIVACWRVHAVCVKTRPLREEPVAKTATSKLGLEHVDLDNATVAMKGYGFEFTFNRLL